MQQVDYTTLMAVCRDIQRHGLPARLESVYQRDRHSIALGLRTLQERRWLTLSWHPQAARLCFEAAPPRTPDTFTFSQQLQHQLGRLALVAISPVSPWERVLDLQFAQRPGDSILWHLYAEIMGKYSNVILVNRHGEIVTAAHQVNDQQSRLRPVLTGQPYCPPPALTDTIPRQDEPFETWRDRLRLIPGSLRQSLLKNYRGLSSALVLQFFQSAGLEPNCLSEKITDEKWQHLFQAWHHWLTCLAEQTFEPRRDRQAYSVIPWNFGEPESDLHHLLEDYYHGYLQEQEWQRLRHQLLQKLSHLCQKLAQKIQEFQTQLAKSATSDRHRYQADLLMAHLQAWEPGLTTIILQDFETHAPVTIPLNPEKNAVQNAQHLYKQHQKLKRARQHLLPLLEAAENELAYLQQVQVAVEQCQPNTAANPESKSNIFASLYQILEDIRDELIQENYLPEPDYRRSRSPALNYLQYQTPSGLSVYVGRNNHQNDHLTFRVASAYDLWFHSQEIPGSHVVLRLDAGHQPSEKDLQWVANIAAYHSRASQSAQVPVVYTPLKYVHKPKGAAPGMVVYQQETVIWGYPLTLSQDSP